MQSFKDDSQSIIITAMNISFFIPIGFLFRNKKGSFSILIILLVLLFVETTQYIFKLGIFDIDDIIFNFIGFVIGYKIIGKIFTSKK
ncbi:MAG: VanZ family protein [Clostridia bacterium]|nr:VanZ family protein [Clostridia bacterium]